MRVQSLRADCSAFVIIIDGDTEALIGQWREWATGQPRAGGLKEATSQGVSELATKMYPLVFTNLIAQLVKNPPAMWETLVQFLGREDLLEKG